MNCSVRECVCRFVCSSCLSHSCGSHCTHCHFKGHEHKTTITTIINITVAVNAPTSLTHEGTRHQTVRHHRAGDSTSGNTADGAHETHKRCTAVSAAAQLENSDVTERRRRFTISEHFHSLFIPFVRRGFSNYPGGSCLRFPPLR